jgi:hypothetical protein
MLTDRVAYPFLPDGMGKDALDPLLAMREDDPDSFVDRFRNSLVLVSVARRRAHARPTTSFPSRA